ncbi:MAG: MoaD/ThiS family protein [Cyclobacteriaceae bacterium]
MAKIIIPTPLRKFTNNQSTVTANGSTIQESIGSLAQIYPELQKHLFDERGYIRSFVKIFLEDEDINQLQREKTPITADAVISIVPAIAGGIEY